MVKCHNCGNNASYTNTDLGGNHTNYCVECLPTWLQKRAIAGEFPLVKSTADDEAKPAGKKKKIVEDKPAVEDTVEEIPAAPTAEEPSTEETPADEDN